MTFGLPAALLLLLVLPPVWYIGRPRHAFRRRRDEASRLLRTLILLLLILALAGLQVVRPVERLAVIFLVDASDSMGPAARAAQLDYLQQAVAARPVDDLWGVVVFGETVSIDQPLTALPAVAPIRSAVLPGQTALAEALQAALSLFPADTVRRIVLLSDGQETVGNARTRAQFAAAAGVEISYVPFRRPPLPDVRVTTLEAPARVIEGQEFDLSVTIEAGAATPATLLIFAGGRLVSETALQLQPGSNGYTLLQTAQDSGFLDFSARVVVPQDGISQNNDLAAFTQVIGAPRVLLVAASLDDIVHLRPALTAAGFAVDVRTPASLPPDTGLLADYQSIVLVNTPATALSGEQMLRLQSYVRDLGGGLVVIGGPQAYGPGGYYQTPLADTLPLDMQIRDQQRMPQLTIAYLIDRSGSMAATDASGIPNLELAKRAIGLSIDFLQPTDRVGIGSFDTGGAWVVPVQPVADRRELQRLVGTLRPGGGTDILAGMRLVERDLVGDPSQRKHIMLLTDGGSSALGLVELAQQLHDDYDITTSVIAVGARPPAFLAQMATAGGGNYHPVQDISQIPNIFALETALATRTYISEGTFSLVQTAASPILNGLPALPPLRGYVVTGAKSTAQVVLRGPAPFNDPLLAQWQYGLGRAVAFTSDATARWAADWVTWADYARFWSQAVGWTITTGAQTALETRVVMQEGRARLVVDARTPDGAFLNNLALQVRLLTPQNAARTLALAQVAPGRYEAEFTPEGEGAYFLALSGQSADPAAPPLREVNGWVMGYSAEYRQAEPNLALLADLATLTGGRDLSADPAAAFARTAALRTAATPVMPWLLLLAALLLPLDIAVRRLIITRSDWQRLRQALGRGASASPEHTERLATLKDVRNRARERTAGVAGDNPAPGPATPERPPAPGAPAAPAGPAGRLEETLYTPADPPRPAAGEASTVGALLKRRKREDDPPA